MVAASLKSAIKALVGRRVSFLAGFFLRGTFRLVFSGFRLRPKGPMDRLADYVLCEDIVILNRYYLQLLLHILRIRRIARITVSWTCATEGAGYQILMRMRALGFARSLGLEYHHTPLFDVHQHEGEMQDYCAKWERLFNIGHDEPQLNTVELSILDFSLAPNSALPALFNRTDTHFDVEAVIPDLRKKYRLTNPRREKTGDRLLVCMHVRRGWDIGPFRPDMWTEDDKVVSSIAWIRQVLDQAGIAHEICLVSRGEEDEFRTTFGDGITYCLNEPSDVAVRRLIEADVLVMARSSFSYVAGIVCEGIKIYEPCAYPPLSGWLVMDGLGRVDQTAFEQALPCIRS